MGDPTTYLEPPARVRYPAKRITMADIRKRIRNLLDYVGRVQSEEARRKERAEILAIDIHLLPDQVQVAEADDMCTSESPSKSITITSEVIEQDYKPNHSVHLLDDLESNLIAFQETLAQGNFVSPFLPMDPSFASQSPVTPSVPSFPSMIVTDPIRSEEMIMEQVREEDAVDVYREEDRVNIVRSEEAELQAAHTVDTETHMNPI